MLQKLINLIVRPVERKGYTLTTESDANRNYAVSRADIRVGNRVYPCDTAIDLDPDQPRGSEKVTFTTHIHDAVEGENAERFDGVIDRLNYGYPGKFVRDFSDGSQDILYTTSERLRNITTKVVIGNLDHHAQVKAQVTPELEHLSTRLGLKPKSSPTQAEQFADDWDKVFKGLPDSPGITYLPRAKK